MNTKNTTQERISAFADGELAADQDETVLAALRTSDGRAAWDIYHQIGDTLRSEDMALKMSPDFAARLAMRLDDEPTIVVPVVTPQQMEQSTPVEVEEPFASHKARKHLVLQGMAAAAAAAALAFVGVPQLMVAMKTDPATDNATTMVASASQPAPIAANTRVVARQEGEVLRDPGIDEYLLAHQRFSPSVYSTAQYARSATFAVDSDK